MQQEDPFITGLRQFLAKNPRFKPATVSEAAGLNKSAIRKMLDGQVTSPRHKTMASIANVLGVTTDQIITQAFSTEQLRGLAVAGRVGAGAKVELVDAYAKGDGIYRVVVPDGLGPHGLVAVEVEGDSMAPIYQPGTVLFYSREVVGVPSEAIGRICVCEDIGGQGWVKVVRVGREEGTFSLISLNPEAENMHGVRLKWAAPVKYSLPPEYVQRVE